MAELQNILQRANQIETEITNHYGKLKTVRKLHESLESLNKKNATMQFKKAKELKRARKLESGESELSLERKFDTFFFHFHFFFFPHFFVTFFFGKTGKSRLKRRRYTICPLK